MDQTSVVVEKMIDRLREFCKQGDLFSIGCLKKDRHPDESRDPSIKSERHLFERSKKLESVLTFDYCRRISKWILFSKGMPTFYC